MRRVVYAPYFPKLSAHTVEADPWFDEEEGEDEAKKMDGMMATERGKNEERRTTGKERTRGGRGKECMCVYYAFYIREYPHWLQCCHEFLENFRKATLPSLARLRRTEEMILCSARRRDFTLNSV